MALDIDAKLAELGLSLPETTAPAANYVPHVKAGDTLYVSGQISAGPEGLVTGVLGDDLDVEGGAAAARLCGLSLLAQVKSALGGDWSRLEQVVKLTIFVASAPGFTDQPKVGNGCSDLLVEVLGDAGRHARSAVGVAALPLGVAVEVEGIFRVK
ncbi:RidA family protein [Pseudoroseicyclus aestuarii]|uniref:Enamine deaminase RidA (YjgF/YER057c/UK114 family) n=1 Tax=Pseudoroseicyclus aestuarii TaxID=1795041 RepID=A0A318SPB0_9RHOB|nr:RidA family protein [Pseudoroseicyclus aestuarii]PYE83710.1 enamine deaminase RidA (YjgF/YER057c/UK114 family) [Pseudoroseicyclus aestuarii]